MLPKVGTGDSPAIQVNISNACLIGTGDISIIQINISNECLFGTGDCPAIQILYVDTLFLSSEHWSTDTASQQFEEENEEKPRSSRCLPFSFARDFERQNVLSQTDKTGPCWPLLWSADDAAETGSARAHDTARRTRGRDPDSASREQSWACLAVFRNEPHRLSPESDTDVARSPETGFTSPKLGSISPENDIDISPETSREDKKKKKLVRTCYTNEQIQTLLKMFHDNPYPDSEEMEDIPQTFGVPDNKIKIWFQNKRARWRRRVNESVNSYPTGYMPMTPAISSVSPFSYMTSGHMMAASSPQHMTGGYFNPWMQTNSISSNNNSSTQHPVNPTQSQLSPMSPSLSNQRYPSITMTSGNVSSFSSAPIPYSIRTSPQQVMTSHFPSVTISPNNNSYLSSVSLSLAYPRSSSQETMTSHLNPSYQYYGQCASGYSGYTNPRAVN
ncbi:ISX-like protein [Mya arenaria]|uniref:ISX-like protein n=1 Tax=Mya arenaria TaxID=6604 RepID=A0ABY7DIS4_MYAAR|nr:ISX-like protein [Mya arenaria]